MSRKMGYISSVDDAKEILEKNSIKIVQIYVSINPNKDILQMVFENLSSICLNGIINTYNEIYL